MKRRSAAKRWRCRATCLWALAAAALTSLAAAQDSASFLDAIRAATPLLDLRLRYEDVVQQPLPVDAVALTLRARIGFVTGAYWQTALLAEANLLAPLRDDYRTDSAVPSNTLYPVIADARDHVINRLQLTNTALPDTTLILGRQRIDLDDQRFVGNSSWRQNEQTFDALRVITQPVRGLDMDLTYSNRVHRVYGQDSPQGTFDGDTYLANISHQSAVGKLTGFAYLISFKPVTNFAGLTASAAAVLNPARSSTDTYGARFTGSHSAEGIKWGYTASYATQQQRGDNPMRLRNDYVIGELSAAKGPILATVGDETLQGNGSVGFATPFATNHRFDGWADKFLTTPVNGLANRYASLAYELKPLGPLQSLSMTAIYRAFAAQHVEASYGSEWDWQLSGKWRRLTATLAYADYSAAATTPASVARDTQKLFALLEFVR